MSVHSLSVRRPPPDGEHRQTTRPALLLGGSPRPTLIRRAWVSAGDGTAVEATTPTLVARVESGMISRRAA